MENASKALLIAAGILIGLIVITMIIYAYGQVSNYYTTKEETKKSEQLAEFNNQYIGYNRKDVRGSDLLSLVNKIIDYNQPKINDVNDEKIKISINIGNVEEFYFDYSNNKNVKLIEPSYTEATINNKLVAPANTIEGRYSQALAIKLSSKISTLMGENSRQTPEQLFTELKINASDYAGGIQQIQNDILKYYQYVQFKRAHFDCTNLTYKDGRVKSFTFVFNGTFE